MKVRSGIVFVFVLLMLGAVSPAWAQTDEEHFQTFPFNFSAPGARPSALGGAFIGLASDASAAVTNPAGLTNLLRRQVYFEFKSAYSPVYRLDGRDSLITGFGSSTAPRMAFPGFINVAVPFRNKAGDATRFTVGFTYQQFLRFKDNFSLAARRSYTFTDPVFPAVQTSLDYTGSMFMPSIGYAVTNCTANAAGCLRVGASVSLNRLNASSTSVRARLTNALYGDLSVPNTAVDKAVWATGANLGVLYQAHRMLSIGFNYTKAPNFSVTEHVTAPYSGYTPPAGTTLGDQTVQFRVPDRMGVGFVFSPQQRINVLFDAVRVRYSQMGKSTSVLYYKYYPFERLGIGTQRSTLEGDPFTVDDATELHGGFEYLLERKHQLYARAGAFTSAPHITRFAKSAGLIMQDPTQKSAFVPCPPNVDPAHNGSTIGCYPAELVAAPLFAVANTYIGKEGGGGSLVDGITLKNREFGLTFGAGISFDGGASLKKMVSGGFEAGVAYVVTSNTRRNELVISLAARF